MTSTSSQSDQSAAEAPEVSVILPCYNSHRFLQQTIDSLRAQTFRDFEIILVNDGSTDPDTISFIASLADDVQVIEQHNMGLSAARNTGIRAARGTLILPLDCDDWLDPTTLQKMRDRLHELPESAFVYTHMRMTGDLTGTLEKDYNYFEQLFFNQLPYCLMLRRVIWQQIGGYDESMRRGYEDWEYNIRLGRHDHFGVAINEPLFNYRIAETGMLKSISQRLHGHLWRSIQKKNPDAYRISELIKAWRRWRHTPSTYPLALYFGWLLMHRILPAAMFRSLFNALLPYRQSARVAD